MTFKTGEKGLGYYSDSPVCEVSLAKELLPMISCTTLRLKIDEILAAIPK